MDEATDREIWKYAGDQNYVVVSKDEDFFHLANAKPQNQGSQLIWICLGNCRKVL